MNKNYVKLFQDARIETIVIVANEIFIIFDEDIYKLGQNNLESTYNVNFINARCCILSICDEV